MLKFLHTAIAWLSGVWGLLFCFAFLRLALALHSEERSIKKL